MRLFLTSVSLELCCGLTEAVEVKKLHLWLVASCLSEVELAFGQVESQVLIHNLKQNQKVSVNERRFEMTNDECKGWEGGFGLKRWSGRSCHEEKGSQRMSEWKSGGVTREGEPIVLLTWPVQLPRRRVITALCLGQEATHAGATHMRTQENVAMDTCDPFYQCEK